MFSKFLKLIKCKLKKKEKRDIIGPGLGHPMIAARQNFGYLSKALQIPSRRTDSIVRKCQLGVRLGIDANPTNPKHLLRCTAFILSLSKRGLRTCIWDAFHLHLPSIQLSSTLYKCIKTFFPPIGLHSLLLPNSRKSRRFELITIGNRFLICVSLFFDFDR